jgi:hypothetical protein
MQMSSEIWVIDSGTSNHMSGDMHLFKTYITISVPRKAFTASSFTSLTILGEGEVVLEVWHGKHPFKPTILQYQIVGLKGRLHVQGLSRRTISLPAAVAKGANMSITKSGCAWTINDQKIGVGTKV